jgi:hypothetical protein
MDGFEGRAQAPRFARIFPKSTCSAIARASSTSIPDFGMPEQKLNGPLATAGIESFRIAREAFKELEMSEGGRTIILIGLLRRCRPDQRANPRVPARRFALVDTSVRRW